MNVDGSSKKHMVRTSRRVSFRKPCFPATLYLTHKCVVRVIRLSDKTHGKRDIFWMFLTAEYAEGRRGGCSGAVRF